MEYVTDNTYEKVVMPEFVLRSMEEVDNLVIDNLKLIYVQVYNSVKYAISEDLLTVPVIRLMLVKPPDGTFLFNEDLAPCTIIIKRDNFDEALEYCLEYFTEIEEYEICAEIVKIIKEQ